NLVRDCFHCSASPSRSIASLTKIIHQHGFRRQASRSPARVTRVPRATPYARFLLQEGKRREAGTGRQGIRLPHGQSCAHSKPCQVVLAAELFLICTAPVAQGRARLSPRVLSQPIAISHASPDHCTIKALGSSSHHIPSHRSHPSNPQSLTELDCQFQVQTRPSLSHSLAHHNTFVKMRFSIIAVAALGAVANAQIDSFLSSVRGDVTSLLSGAASVATSLANEVTQLPGEIQSRASEIQQDASEIRASITQALASATGPAAQSSASAAIASIENSLSQELASITGAAASAVSSAAGAATTSQSTDAAHPTALPAMGAVAVGLIGLAGLL
ncbi:hypothetical protein EJ04DRAFT_605845, partial [Polyplosphaeria fusca]